MLNDVLQRLAAMEPTPLPFISAYVDLTPELEGSHRSEGGPPEKQPVQSWRRGQQPEQRQFRPGCTRLRALISAKEKLLPIRGPERESFDADIARINRYLEEEIDPSSHGAAIFACAGEGIWETVALSVPVENCLAIDRSPYIHPLAQVQDTYDRYALCLADSQTARIYVVTLGRAEREETVEGPAINYKMTGGWSQKRIQQRIQNAVSDHIREVAARLEAIVFAEDLRRIIVAGDEIVQTEFQRHLSDRAKERLVEMSRLDTKLPEHEAIARSLETIRDAERAEAQDLARQALDATLSNGLGAAGAEAVVQALRQGAVDTLILDKEFEAQGWRCVEDRTLAGKGEVPAEAECPVGPGPAEPADLREELVTQAVQTGAVVEFVENSEALARMGGVGALLRWRPADLPDRVTAAH